MTGWVFDIFLGILTSGPTSLVFGVLIGAAMISTSVMFYSNHLKHKKSRERHEKLKDEFKTEIEALKFDIKKQEEHLQIVSILKETMTDMKQSFDKMITSHERNALEVARLTGVLDMMISRERK